MIGNGRPPLFFVSLFLRRRWSELRVVPIAGAGASMGAPWRSLRCVVGGSRPLRFVSVGKARMPRSMVVADEGKMSRRTRIAGAGKVVQLGGAVVVPGRKSRWLVSFPAWER